MWKMRSPELSGVNFPACPAVAHTFPADFKVEIYAHTHIFTGSAHIYDALNPSSTMSFGS